MQGWLNFSLAEYSVPDSLSLSWDGLAPRLAPYVTRLHTHQQSHSLNVFCVYKHLYSHLFLADRYYYGIRIVTGSQARAGTDFNANISVTLIGDKARSDGDKLLAWWELRISNQQCNDLILEGSQSVGQVQVVKLENKARGRHGWFVDFMEVHDFASAEKKVFACYHWIGAEDSVSCSSSTS